MQRHERVRWIWNSADNDELARRYDEWASSYDVDLDAGFGWIGPRTAAAAFRRWVPLDARVLDAGAGTGLVGQALAAHGYAELVAADLSLGMLDQARKKGIYKEFHQAVLGEVLAFDGAAFDAVISVGVLTQGHAPPSSLNELVRITRAGGHIVFSLRTDVYADGGFKERQAALETEGRWTRVERSAPYRPLPKGEPEVSHRVWVYRVN